MRRTVILLVVLVGLIASACAGTEDASSSTSAPDATTAPSGDGSLEGPSAPDFTLTLGTGSETFTLSEEAKPVYMVFWAEW